MTKQLRRQRTGRIYFVHRFQPTHANCLTDANLEFGVQPSAGAYIQEQFQNFQRIFSDYHRQLRQQLDRMDANTANTRILFSNQRNRETTGHLRPLRKNVGSVCSHCVDLIYIDPRLRGMGTTWPSPFVVGTRHCPRQCIIICLLQLLAASPVLGTQ